MDALISAFEARGAVHIGSAVDAGRVAALRSSARREFDERDARAAQGALTPDVAEIHARRSMDIADLGVADALADPVFTPEMRALAQHYLATDRYRAETCRIRDLAPARADTHLPFHQDERILGTRILNIWVALTPCGVDAPGLQFVLGRDRPLLEVSPPPGARRAVDKARIDETVLLQTAAPEELWSPPFRPGDAMIFAGTVPHRTYVTPEMTLSRMSLEMRIVATSPAAGAPASY